MLRDERGVQQLLTVVYAQLARWNVNRPKREQRELRIARSEQAGEILRLTGDRQELARFVRELRRWVERHRQIAEFRSLKHSGLVVFAEQLGVSARLLREGLDGSPGPKLWVAFQEFLVVLDGQADKDAIDRGTIAEFLELGSVYEEKVYLVERMNRRTGRMEKKRVVRVEPRPSQIRTETYVFGGDGTSGRQWTQQVGRFAMPTVDPSGKDAWGLIEKMVAFVRAVEPMSWRRYPHWVTKAVFSMLTDREDRMGRKGSIKKSDPQFRKVEHPKSAQFVVNNAHSSGEFHGAHARERSIRRFIERAGEALDSSDLVFVQGVVAWQFRYRGKEEQRAREETREVNRDLAEKRDRRLRDQRLAKKRAQRKRSKVLVGVLERRQQRKKKS